MDANQWWNSQSTRVYISMWLWRMSTFYLHGQFVVAITTNISFAVISTDCGIFPLGDRVSSTPQRAAGAIPWIFDSSTGTPQWLIIQRKPIWRMRWSGGLCVSRLRSEEIIPYPIRRALVGGFCRRVADCWIV